MAQDLNWERDGRHWPHRERSHFIAAAGLRWHVQHWPAPAAGAPLLLLIHGTGSATHTWRRLAPLLAPHCELLALDLPGHGFSGPAVAAGPDHGASMAGMARGVTALLAAWGAHPRWVLGHSAGAAIAIRMALQAAAGGATPGWAPAGLIALNAALFPLPGVSGALFSPAAKLLALNPLVPHLFAWRARQASVVQKLLASTGSTLDAAGTALYRQVVTSPGHVAGALAMVARWNLQALAAELPALRTPLHLLVGEQDGTVPPADARRALALVPGATLTTLPGLGHLAHEEDAPQVAQRVLALALPSG
jgi:magnesium chelatase accessory protein